MEPTRKGQRGVGAYEWRGALARRRWKALVERLASAAVDRVRAWLRFVFFRWRHARLLGDMVEGHGRD